MAIPLSVDGVVAVVSTRACPALLDLLAQTHKHCNNLAQLSDNTTSDTHQTNKIYPANVWLSLFTIRQVVHHLLREPHNTHFFRTIEKMMLEDQHVLGAIGVGSDSMNNIIRMGCITHLSVSKLAYTEVHPKCRSCQYAYQ